ncbi:10135_t:CDS:2, partial [Paraglomus brasilianum]
MKVFCWTRFYKLLTPGVGYILGAITERRRPAYLGRGCNQTKGLLKKVYRAVINAFHQLNESDVDYDHPLASGIFDLTMRGDEHATLLPVEIRKLLVEAKNHIRDVKLPEVIQGMIDEFMASCKGLRGNVNVRSMPRINNPTYVDSGNEEVVQVVGDLLMGLRNIWTCRPPILLTNYSEM